MFVSSVAASFPGAMRKGGWGLWSFNKALEDDVQLYLNQPAPIVLYYIMYIVFYYIILDHTILYYVFLHSTLLYSTLLYSTLLYSTLLFDSTLLYSTLLYSTLLYSTLLYSTTGTHETLGAQEITETWGS